MTREYLGKENVRWRDRGTNNCKVSVVRTSLAYLGLRKLTSDIGAHHKVEKCSMRDRKS